jgi:ATP-binding cassette, subfamily B, multidrug efflux pump
LNPDDNISQDDISQDDIPQKVSAGSLRRLLRYSLAYPKLLWQAAGLLLIATLGQVLSPIVIKVFIDNHVVLGYYPADTLMLLAAAFILLYLSSAWAGYLQAMRLNRVAFSVVRAIRSQVFASVIRKPLSWFDHRPTGKLVSGITNDTEAIKDLYVQVLSAFVQNITLIIAIFIAMAVLDVRLMLVCIVILPTVIVVMIVYQRLSAPRYHRARSILSQINASLSEAVSGMRIIQIMNQQRRFAGRFTETSQSYFKARMNNLKLDAMMLRPMPDLLRMLTLAGLLLYFGILALDSPLEVGVMYAFINYLSRITQPITEMTQRLSMLQQALVAGERVFKLIDADEDLQPESDQLISSGTVKFDRINFSYDERTPVLRDISFNIEAGRLSGIPAVVKVP